MAGFLKGSGIYKGDEISHDKTLLRSQHASSIYQELPSRRCYRSLATKLRSSLKLILKAEKQMAPSKQRFQRCNKKMADIVYGCWLGNINCYDSACAALDADCDD
jgi:hypothetical protein